MIKLITQAGLIETVYWWRFVVYIVREEQPWFFYEKADTPSVGMKAKSKAISWVIASRNFCSFCIGVRKALQGMLWKFIFVADVWFLVCYCSLCGLSYFCNVLPFIKKIVTMEKINYKCSYDKSNTMRLSSSNFYKYPRSIDTSILLCTTQQFDCVLFIQLKNKCIAQ